MHKVRLIVSNGETFDPGAGAWSLQLAQFEGPLDLLLHLCQKHELNVLDIPIGFVTEKYLEYLAVMQLMQLDVAAEYLVMAATLAHIKSKMLLPAPPPGEKDEDGALEDDVDPREALIRRLLEYQKYKHAAEQLGARGVAGRDVFARGMPVEEAVHRGLPPLADIPLYALVEAFQRVLDRSHVRWTHDVVADRISLSDRIQELSDRMKSRTELAFEDLFEGLTTKFDLVITFLALLEMTKLRMTRLRQSEPLGPLYVELAATEPAGDSGASPDGAPGAPPDRTTELPCDVPSEEQTPAEADLPDAPPQASGDDGTPQDRLS